MAKVVTMSITNHSNQYGWLTIALHWVIALGVLGLFFLGLWMVTLDYYSNWYHQAPWIHKSVGIIVVSLMVLRWLWHRVSAVPRPMDGPVKGAFEKRFERISPGLVKKLVHGFHQLMYVLVVLIGFSGYLISTAEGKPVDVFDWFQVPALPWQFAQQADLAGLAHQWLAYALIALVVVHAAAALKHHFIDRDRTLLRMLKSE
ncbi:MAG: cytochrome b [Hydrogenovibrio sp.]|uniref:cytochrome b n=1 Tax=Hydrogenovibrio sp. TaxID=2065821 RepID=UPI0028706197|nr:cytochrome b [Hydrogenovibrio sp.]MDR9498179.1 cytochrome b [Hydrogenovibrio sp.]